MKIEPGDIIYAPFPTWEGGFLNHYCLVLKVVEEKTITGQEVPTKLLCAYGTSKQVDKSSPLGGEFVLYEPMELEKAGLKKPTKFNLGRLKVFAEQDIISVSGSVNLKDDSIGSRFVRAWRSRVKN